jgi:hypothetical protein
MIFVRIVKLSCGGAKGGVDCRRRYGHKHKTEANAKNCCGVGERHNFEFTLPYIILRKVKKLLLLLSI